MVFHPRYPENQRAFVSYTDANGDSAGLSYRVSSDPDLADAEGASPILRVDQPPFDNRKGERGAHPAGGRRALRLERHGGSGLLQPRHWLRPDRPAIAGARLPP